MDFPAEYRLPQPVYNLLESAYPSVLGEREQIIAEFVRTAYSIPNLHTGDELLRAVRIGLRNSIRLAESNGQQCCYQTAIERLNQFPKSGRTYADRVLMLVAHSREASF